MSNRNLNSSNKVMYAFRGWIAFIALMDGGLAIRSLIEKTTIFRSAIAFSLPPPPPPPSPLFSSDNNHFEFAQLSLRLFAYFTILKSANLLICTLFIHYQPTSFNASISIILHITLYLIEFSYFQTIPFDFFVMLSCLLNFITLIGLITVPKYCNIWNPFEEIHEEKLFLMRQAVTNIKKKRQKAAAVAASKTKHL